MNRSFGIFKCLLLVILSLIFIGESRAQYFGKNKPKYRNFPFKVYETENFSIHSYLKNPAAVSRVASWCEQWYDHHQRVLGDTIDFKNPFILYNNHADFQQTNTIGGSIGVGTGGVTEGFKNRVILPLAFTNRQTHHVIGHELVHAFQYNMILKGDSTNIRNMGNLPLWMVEGLAEYLSIGKVDAHTAMWMRDAVLNKDIPELKDLQNPKYFPYRYGHTFWSFITSYFGDEIIEPLFVNTAKYGLSEAINSTLGVRPDTLSNIWQRTLKSHYADFIGTGKEKAIGKKIITDKNAGRINISPSISPNGRYVVFLSEKNLLTMDLFVAETKTGKIIEKLTSTTRDSHLDALNFIESSGSWSPNGKEFVFVAFKKGRNVLVVKDIENGKTVDEVKITGVRAISNPMWSPKGRKILFSGLVEGETNLYIYDLKRKILEQLTDNAYSEIQATWSADGENVLFATDELASKGEWEGSRFNFNLAIINLESGQVEHLKIFNGANNLNPNYDHNGNIVFLSDRDGYRNIYSYSPDSNKVYKLTDFLTGVSGITMFSPAISLSRKNSRILYTHYYDDNYSIYEGRLEKLLKREIPLDSVDFKAAELPFKNKRIESSVQRSIDVLKNTEEDAYIDLETKSYRPKFQLDALINSGIGVGVGNGLAGTQTALAGGVGAIFSDMLGHNQLFGAISLNGEIIDFGGQFQYINRQGRLPWGVTLSHIPNRTGGFSYSNQQIDVNGQTVNAILQQLDELRIFEENLGGFIQYPFSRTLRAEANIGATYRFFRWDRTKDYFSQNGFFIKREKERVDVDDEISINGFTIKKALFYNTGAALVVDNSYFGIASPLAGHRFRISFDQYFGAYKFSAANIDLRKYFWLRPISFAFRLQHYAQFGSDIASFYPILIGQMGFVRGFDYSHLDKNRDRYDLNFNRLSGTKFALGGFEVRLPLTGFERLALIRSSFFFTELSVFVDSGVAFDEYDDLSIKREDDPGNSRPALVASTGVSLRINLFGALILEPYYAWPIRDGMRPVFGFNILPGW